MPEIPDLEAIRGFLNERIVGVEVTKAEALTRRAARPSNKGSHPVCAIISQP
jgi:formamidopyrimidine-DNA glycosylase